MIRRGSAPDSSSFEMSPSDVISRTVPGQRLLEQQWRKLPVGAGYGVALVSAFLLHGAVFSVVYFENWFAQSPVTNPTEIPIEIVAEPPPPPPPPPPAQPKQDSAETKPEETPPPPIDNEVATDAPRPASKEKVERKATDEATKTPPAPKETAEANPGGSAGQASPDPPQQGETKATESASAPDLNKPDAEIIRSAVESSLQKAEQASRAVTQGQPYLAGSEMFPAWSVGQQAANFEHMMEAAVGSEADDTPIAGGKADRTYKTTLYGMIAPHVHSPAVLHNESANGGGEVDFIIDGKGNLRKSKLIHSSGFPDVDSIWLAAIAQAAPFPRPPGGMPMTLVLTYPGK